MAGAITDTQRDLYEHVRVYRSSTANIITEAVCGGSENLMKKLILRSRDHIASDKLGPKGVTYRFTPAGAKLVGAPEESARPQGPQAFIKNLGILGYCCGGPTKRRRYTRPEFMEDFSDISDDLIGKDYHTDFYLDFDGTDARLGQIVVDQGGDYRKLISKCRMRLREYLDVPNVRDLVADGLFTVAIVVAEEEKAQAIRLAVKEKPLRARVVVETSAELQRFPIQIPLGGLE